MPLNQGAAKSTGASVLRGSCRVSLALLLVLLTTQCNAFNMVISSPVGRQLSAKPTVFKKDFAQPMGIPEESIDGVVEVLRSGRLNRYSCSSAETSHVARVEQEFVEAVDHEYALGTNSCSSAILIALLSVGVKPGDEVLSNAFTFTAVPSTILRLGAEPVLVESLDRCVTDPREYPTGQQGLILSCLSSCHET